MVTPATTRPSVPLVNQRKRIPQNAIDDVVQQIAAKFQPEKIILFGSYAYVSPVLKAMWIYWSS
jgi:hypothetical protein